MCGVIVTFAHIAYMIRGPNHLHSSLSVGLFHWIVKNGLANGYGGAK